MDAREVKIPLTLLVAGLVLVVVYLAAFAGAAGAAVGVVAVSVGLAVQVVLGIIALYIVAALLSIGFGSLATAALKLAAIFIFPGAIALFLPAGLDWLVALGLYVILLMWLLELENLMELVVCVIVIALVRALTMNVIAAAIGGA